MSSLGDGQSEDIQRSWLTDAIGLFPQSSRNLRGAAESLKKAGYRDDAIEAERLAEAAERLELTLKLDRRGRGW